MNKYVWDLYLKSGGQEVVDFFEDNLVNGLEEEYVDRINEFQRVYCVSEGIIKCTSEKLRKCVEIIKIDCDTEEYYSPINEDFDYSIIIDDIVKNLWIECLEECTSEEKY